MSGLEDLYREIILDHYRNPRNRGELDVPPATLAEGFNPLCGDEIKIFLEIDDPSKADGTDAEKLEAFRRVAKDIADRVRLFVLVADRPYTQATHEEIELPAQ